MAGDDFLTSNLTGEDHHLRYLPDLNFHFLHSVDHTGAKIEVWVNHSLVDDGTASLLFIWWFHDEVSGLPGLDGYDA